MKYTFGDRVVEIHKNSTFIIEGIVTVEKTMVGFSGDGDVWLAARNNNNFYSTEIWYYGYSELSSARFWLKEEELRLDNE